MSSRNKIILGGGFLITLILLALIYFLVPKLIITLNGDKNINIYLGDKYIEEGATSKYISLSTQKSLDVEISGNVNTNKPGKYIVTYKVKSDKKVKETIRVVNVIDNIKPEIVVEGDVLLCKEKGAIDFNVKVTDNIDGDISDKIQYTIDNDNIHFFAKDQANNETIVSQKIKIIDSEKPKITLNGSKTIYLLVNEEYTEFGATAFDSCDGDVTSSITISHNIDITMPNEYEVTYKAVDRNGNEATAKRYVIVTESEKDKDKMVVNGATIYLTFDDGPGPYTEKLLDILDKYNIKATFFVTGQFSDYQSLIKEEYNRGHTVGIHTYTHKWTIYKSEEAYLNDFTEIDNIIYAETGVHTKIMRFPGGSSNNVSKSYSKGIMTKLTKLMEEKGYKYYDWNVDSGDTSKTNNSKEAIVNNIKNSLNGDGEYIILMHDIKKNTLDALPYIIEYATKLGYTFDKITENTTPVHLKVVN